MREILFRGKKLDNGGWVYGSLFGKRHIAVEIREGEEPVSSFGVATYRWVEVIPETVGQYTGLDDKNGVKIFEGDILRDDESIVVVKFVDGGFSVDYRTIGGKWRNYSDLFDYLDDYEGEIIGNIYDNPELAEE